MKFSSASYTSLNLIMLFLYLLLISSCVGKQKEVEDKSNIPNSSIILSIPDTLATGKIYNRIEINHDPLNTFALYLPKIYDIKMDWPVVFFFDAGGNGILPITKYQTIADSLGYIFLGSNVLKNGLAIDDAINNWNTIKNACLNNFSIDKNRVVLAGFSGGARTACAVASQDQFIAGVIANSAGAQQLDNLLGPNTFFLGLCGKGDMNRAEMLSIEQYLSSTAITHFYLEFDGIHEWAPKSAMQKALTIATLQSGKNNQTFINNELLDVFNYNQQKEIENLLAANKWVEAYNEHLLLANATKGLDEVNNYEIMDSIKNNPNFIVQKNEMIKLNTIETEIQQELYKLMLEKPDSIIWKQKIDAIRKQAAKKNNLGQMNQRLLGYASLVCYSLSNRMLVAKNYVAANMLITCYEIADPENAEVYFFKALITGKAKNKFATIANLKKAMKLGLNDKSRIKLQQEFKFLEKENDFKDLFK